MKTKPPTLVLLDAHAILHRGYHAMQGFSTRDGRPTGALYGFITMVLRIYNDIQPDYIAACFDLPKPTFRHESYDGYKAGRQKTDDALVVQIQAAQAMCAELNIPTYALEGFEADDLLGTIAEQVKRDTNMRVIIASGDMDTMQLIEGDRVVVYTLKRGNDTQLYNEKAVMERFGFGPLLIPDYKGLAGDSSDNIIGIVGIGDKSATDLIKHFGSIEDMYKALATRREDFLHKGIKERIVRLLEEGEEDALFSKTLATIRRDAPITYVTPETTWLQGVDVSRYEALCDLYEFRSLKHKLGEQKSTQVDAPAVEEKIKEPVAIDEGLLEKIRVAHHMLHSEDTNRSYEDIIGIYGNKPLGDIYEEVKRKLAETGLLPLYETVEEPLIALVAQMSQTGITLDVEMLKKLSTELHEYVTTLEREIHELAGVTFNIASPKQLGDVLYDQLHLGSKIKKTKTGAKSTNAAELEKIQDEHPVVAKVLQYREVTKLLSTYIDTLPTYVKEDGRIHAHFVQTGAGTGRFSCEDPNLQNIPIKSELGQKVRAAFVAAEGTTLLSCDYGQVDLRAAAMLSHDPHLTEIFTKNIDVHTGTAARVFGVKEADVTPDMRRKAKAINFGILYGMGVTALKDSMGVERKEAQEFYDQYKFTFSRLMTYLEEVKAYAWKYGYTMTLLGRRREVPLLKSPLPYLRAQGERIAINAPIQGTSADILKLAIIDADAYIREHSLHNTVKLVIQIHDELVFEIKKEIAEDVADELVKVLENVLARRKLTDIPLTVSRSLGKNLQAL